MISMHHSLKKLRYNHSNECYKIIIQRFAKLLLIVINPDTKFINSLPTKWQIMIILKEIQSFFSTSNVFLGFFSISFCSLHRWHTMHLMHLSTFFEPCTSCRWREQILFSWKFKRGMSKSGSSRETVVEKNLKSSQCWIEILPRIRFGFHMSKSKEIKSCWVVFMEASHHLLKHITCSFLCGSSHIEIHCDSEFCELRKSQELTCGFWYSSISETPCSHRNEWFCNI